MRDIFTFSIILGCALPSFPSPFHRLRFFTTDSYAKHHLKLQKLFDDVFSEARLQAQHSTPKAVATGKKVRAFELYGEGTIIAGEPLHDLFKLRSLTSVFANDTFDMLDHKDALLRLSRPPPSTAHPARLRSGPPDLGDRALELLQLAVRLPKSKYQAEAEKYDEATVQELRVFLQDPLVRKAPIWRAAFKAQPPRRTRQRLAAAAGAVLHAQNQDHGYERDDDFRAEVLYILTWCAPGRKSCRRKRGIRRGMRDTSWKAGRRSAVTCKVRKHFATLLNHRMECLLRWRLAAREEKRPCIQARFLASGSGPTSPACCRQRPASCLGLGGTS